MKIRIGVLDGSVVEKDSNGGEGINKTVTGVTNLSGQPCVK
jgi:hypothetical protein